MQSRDAHDKISLIIQKNLRDFKGTCIAVTQFWKEVLCMFNIFMWFKRESVFTVGKKSIRALEIVLAIFLCFECQFLSFYACYKEYKA